VNADRLPVTAGPAALREAFDRSFAEAPRSATAALEDLLCIRVGEHLHALRVAELSGLFPDMKVMALPTAIAELLGLASLRAAILPIYDLRLMLGYGGEAKPRWVAIARDMSVGLAFDGFEGHIRVSPDAVVSQGSGESGVRHVREVVRIDGQLRSIVLLASVLEAITNRVRAGAGTEE
jgi:chemotaxis signal transduction protein